MISGEGKSRLLFLVVAHFHLKFCVIIGIIGCKSSVDIEMKSKPRLMKMIFGVELRLYLKMVQ